MINSWSNVRHEVVGKVTRRIYDNKGIEFLIGFQNLNASFNFCNVWQKFAKKQQQKRKKNSKKF